ncbi:MAG TPA: hypothetical protein VGC93_07085 [Thermoanaerobaculia bacterium]
MHLTIDSFHARFTSPEPEAFVAALRALPPVEDIVIIVPEQWTQWNSTAAPREEGPSLCMP